MRAPLSNAGTTHLIFEQSKNEFNERKKSNASDGGTVTRDAKSMTKEQAGSAKTFVKSADGFLTRARTAVSNAVSSRFGRKPAPAPEERSAFGAKLVVGLPAMGSQLEVWNALTTKNLPASYSPSEIEHRSYTLFKAYLGAAAVQGTKTLAEVLGRLPDLSAEKSQEISKNFLNDLKGNIGPELDASYKAIRGENPTISLTMPMVLMRAFPPALAKALKTTSAKFADPTFAKVASDLFISIEDVKIPNELTQSAAGKLPLKFSLLIKAGNVSLKAETAVDVVVMDAETEASTPTQSVEPEQGEAAIEPSQEAPELDTENVLVAVVADAESDLGMLPEQSEPEPCEAPVELPQAAPESDTETAVVAAAVDAEPEVLALPELPPVDATISTVAIYRRFSAADFVQKDGFQVFSSEAAQVFKEVVENEPVSPPAISADLAPARTKDTVVAARDYSVPKGYEPPGLGDRFIGVMRGRPCLPTPTLENTNYRSAASVTAEPAASVKNKPGSPLRRLLSSFFRRKEFERPAGEKSLHFNVNPVKPVTKSPVKKVATVYRKFSDIQKDLRSLDPRLRKEMQSPIYKGMRTKIKSAWASAKSECKRHYAGEKTRSAISQEVDRMENLYKKEYDIAYMSARSTGKKTISESMSSAQELATFAVWDHHTKLQQNNPLAVSALVIFEDALTKITVSQKVIKKVRFNLDA